MASSVLLVIVIGLVMITAPAFVFNNSGYLLAKKESSSGSGSSDSGSSSSSGSSGSDNKDSGTSDKGSDSGSGSSPSDSGSGSSNNNDNPTTPTDNQLPEAQPSTPSTPPTQPSETLKENPITPTTPNPKDKPVCMIPEGCGPISPNPNPNPVIGTPNFSCHFHPESPKCSPDKNGNCPGGFAKNDKGQCHPTGPCPPGFGRHDNDESGKCFRNPGNGIHFPPFIHCPPGFGNDHGNCVKNIFINIKTHHSSSSSSSGSSSISNKCIAEIKIAWLGKVHRGENHEVDQIIDRCLGIH